MPVETLCEIGGGLAIAGAALIAFAVRHFRNSNLPEGAYRYKGQLVLPYGRDPDKVGRVVKNLDEPQAPPAPPMPDIKNGDSKSSKN